MTTFSPADVARFDQLTAVVGDTLDLLVDGHRDALAEDRCAITSVAGLAGFLRNRATHEACAEILAIAIDRLARKETSNV